MLKRNPKQLLCSNCRSHFNPEDAYCRICGSKANTIPYNPKQDLMQCIYGPPPVKRTHTCVNCSYSWTTYEMIDDENFCPKCGNSAPVTYEESDF